MMVASLITSSSQGRRYTRHLFCCSVRPHPNPRKKPTKNEAHSPTNAFCHGSTQEYLVKIVQRNTNQIVQRNTNQINEMGISYVILLWPRKSIPSMTKGTSKNQTVLQRTVITSWSIDQMGQRPASFIVDSKEAVILKLRHKAEAHTCRDSKRTARIHSPRNTLSASSSLSYSTSRSSLSFR